MTPKKMTSSPTNLKIFPFGFNYLSKILNNHIYYLNLNTLAFM